jgi:hypothetical protein
MREALPPAVDIRDLAAIRAPRSARPVNAVDVRKARHRRPDEGGRVPTEERGLAGPRARRRHHHVAATLRTSAERQLWRA